MYQESEIVDLLMVVFLTPVMLVSARSIHLPGKRWFVAGYLAIASGFVFTVAEGYLAADALNLMEHISNAVAAICFLCAAGALYTAQRRGGDQA